MKVVGQKNSEELSSVVESFVNEIRQDIDSGEPKRLERALSLYLEVKDREDFRKEPRFHQAAAFLAMKMGSSQDAETLAIESAKTCINLEPNNPKWYHLLAYVYWWYKKTDLAILTQEEALSLAEAAKELPLGLNLADVLGNLAFFYADGLRSEHKAKAKELARRACEMSPAPSKKDTLGYVLLRFAESKKDVEEAIEYFKKALDGAGPYKFYIDQHLREANEKLLIW